VAVAVAHYRRRPLFLSALFSIAIFGGLGASIVVANAPEGLSEVGARVYLRSGGFVLVALVLLWSSLQLAMASVRGPTLAFDDEGLVFRDYVWSTPFRMRWGDIASIGVQPIRSGWRRIGWTVRVLTIEPRDLGALLNDEELDFLGRWAIRSNLRSGFPPVAYPEAWLVEPLEDVARTLNAELERRRGTP
jgi:hypothetical protein